MAGGGRIDKPLLKAGAAYHKYKVKRNCWLAQGPWGCHEPCGASPRRRQPPAHWEAVHRQEGNSGWKEGRSHCCQENGTTVWWKIGCQGRRLTVSTMTIAVQYIHAHNYNEFIQQWDFTFLQGYIHGHNHSGKKMTML